jgi:methylthioxylose transferase
VAAPGSRARTVPRLGRDAGLAAAGGVVLGLACFLSYGAVLFGVPALALLLVLRRWRLVLPATAGALAVVAGFALGGFAWWDGFAALHGRYLAGYGGTRPFAYWSWADLAVLVIVSGPAVVAGLARLLTGPAAGTTRYRGAQALAGGALAALVLAAVTGMSKAEVERIWLPWTVWLPLACALLPAPRVRHWLAAQAALALLLEHLLITPW